MEGEKPENKLKRNAAKVKAKMGKRRLSQAR